MGNRGPLPDPNSRRSRRIAEIAQRRLQRAEKQHKVQSILDGRPVPTTDEQGATPGGDGPQCPAGLPVRVEKYWRDLVAELRAAKVPIVQVDSYAILQVARCLDGIDRCDELSVDPSLDAKGRLEALGLSAQLGKRLDTLLPMVGATPGARVRIGIKTQPPKQKGPLEKLLERKGQQTSSHRTQEPYYK